jgi:hypothetical protein
MKKERSNKKKTIKIKMLKAYELCPEINRHLEENYYIIKQKKESNFLLH